MILHNKIGRLALCAGLLGVAPSARAVTSGPWVTVLVTTDGKVDSYQVELTPGRKGMDFDTKFESSEAGISINGNLDPDPSISYGIAVTDFGAPSSFMFVFSTPIVPTGPSTTVGASVVGGFTDPTGDGVTMTPTFGMLQESTVSAPATSMGVGVGPGFAVGPGAPGAFYSYGPYAAGLVPGPIAAPFWTSLSVTTAFGLSGGGDIAVFTGYAEITTVRIPDGGPGAIAWAGLGLVLVAGRAWRRSARLA